MFLSPAGDKISFIQYMFLINLIISSEDYSSINIIYINNIDMDSILEDIQTYLEQQAAKVRKALESYPNHNLHEKIVLKERIANDLDKMKAQMEALRIKLPLVSEEKAMPYKSFLGKMNQELFMLVTKYKALEALPSEMPLFEEEKRSAIIEKEVKIEKESEVEKPRVVTITERETLPTDRPATFQITIPPQTSLFGKAEEREKAEATQDLNALPCKKRDYAKNSAKGDTNWR